MASKLPQLKTDKALLYRIQKWAWLVMALPTIFLWRNSVLWVAIMSVYANYVSAAGAEAAERARRR